MSITFKYFIIGLILLFNINTYAQKQSPNDNTAKKEKKKKRENKASENIEVFARNYFVRPRYEYPQISVNTTNRLFGKGEKFKYKPSVQGLVGLSFKIKKIFFSFTVQLPLSEPQKRLYGTTKFTDISVIVPVRTLLWSVYYRDYKGFYLKTYEPYYPNWNKDSLGYPKSPGLRIIEAGMNLCFTFNNNFSMNAAFAQGERQKKSAGSFLAGIFEHYQRVEVNTNFVPATQELLYPNLDKFKYGDFISSIFYFGYGYQFVFNRFHFTPVGTMGTGFQVQNYRQVDKKSFRLDVPTTANFKAQIGYNGDHFFTNIIYITEFNTIPIKESKIRLFHNWLVFGIGVRF